MLICPKTISTVSKQWSLQQWLIYVQKFYFFSCFHWIFLDNQNNPKICLNTTNVCEHMRNCVMAGSKPLGETHLNGFPGVPPPLWWRATSSLRLTMKMQKICFKKNLSRSWCLHRSPHNVGVFTLPSFVSITITHKKVSIQDKAMTLYYDYKSVLFVGEESCESRHIRNRSCLQKCWNIIHTTH